jgi:predicted P-loop ATPase
MGNADPAIDYSALIGPVARQILGEPNPKFTTANEMRWGRHGSLSVDIVKGTWYDHETKEGGGLKEFIHVFVKTDEWMKWLREQGHIPDEPRKKKNGNGADHEARPWHHFAYYQYSDDLRVERLECSASSGSKPDKTFRQQRRINGKWVSGVKGAKFPLYRVAELRDAIAGGAVVFIVEGEKKVDLLSDIGVPASCNVGGALKWPVDSQSKEVFRGADVVILPDNDDAGAKHAGKVAEALWGTAKRIRVLDLPDLPPKGGVDDWIPAGGTAEKLFALLGESGRDWQKIEADWDWRLLLKRQKDGVTPSSIEANFAIELHHDPNWHGVFDHDAFSQTLMLRKAIPQRVGDTPAATDYLPRPWADADTANVLKWFQLGDYPNVTLAKVDVAVHLEAVMYRSFHPVRQYLDSLQWDCESRLDSWLENYCVAEIGDDDARHWAKTVGSKWMISAVARIYEPGCQADHCMVLEGPQGCGKTSALRILGEPWFTESLPGDLHSKDASDHIRGKWIVELAELSQIRRSDTETLKAFISRRQEWFRPAYGKKEIAYRRQCIFGGSTNASQYLTDATGGRRFWPVKVGKIDLESLERDRDQLWAEAVARYQTGEQWWLQDDRLQAIAKAEQEDRYDPDLWEEKILAHLEGLSVTNIPNLLEIVFGKTPAQQERRDQMRASDILKRHGWQLKRTMEGRKWVRKP